MTPPLTEEELSSLCDLRPDPVLAKLAAAEIRSLRVAVADAHAAGVREGIDRAARYVQLWAARASPENLVREVWALLHDSPTPPAAAPGDWPDLLHDRIHPPSGRLLKSTSVKAPVSAATVEKHSTLCAPHPPGPCPTCTPPPSDAGTP